MELSSIYESKPWLKFYPPGCPGEFTVEERSMAQAFDQAVAKYKNRTAINFYGKKISYSELGELADRFAAALHGLGVAKGDKVALLLLNSPQFIIAFYGALKAGAVITPISPVYVTKEIKYQLEDSESKHIVCQDILYDRVAKAEIKFDNVIITSIGEYLPSFQKMIGKGVLKSVYRDMEVPPDEIFKMKGVYRFHDLIKKYEPNPTDVKINPKEDLAILPYTGGTTGLPKGVMLTHYNLLANADSFNHFWSAVLKEGSEVFMAIMPFYHIGGLESSVINGIIRGYTLVIFTTVDLDQVLGSIEDNSATMFVSAPSLYETLRKHEKCNRVNWKKLKCLFSGADILLLETAEGWKKKTGTDLYDVYGLTETSLYTHGSPKDHIKVGSFGIPMPNTVAAVLDPSKDEYLPIGEIGEIVVQGPQIFKGYWKNEAETRDKFANIKGKLWFRTGDLGSMDADGYFFIYDRKRDMIKYKGYAVFAREVEEVLTLHPMIKEAGVVGVPDPEVGENVKAVVVLEPEARGKLSEEDIIKYCEENLAHYKIPKIIKFSGEIPKTDVGKVSRRELREE